MRSHRAKTSLHILQRHSAERKHPQRDSRGREPKPDVPLECSLPEPCAWSWSNCVLANGPDFAKIHQSVCIELATDPQLCKHQLDSNEKLLQSSNQLAPVTHERYLPLGSSHLSQFCKAVQANCIQLPET